MGKAGLHLTADLKDIQIVDRVLLVCLVNSWPDFLCMALPKFTLLFKRH